jgi:hypothetical protein
VNRNFADDIGADGYAGTPPKPSTLSGLDMKSFHERRNQGGVLRGRPCNHRRPGMSKSDNVANLVVIALGIFVVYHSYYSLRIGILISPAWLPPFSGFFVVLGLFWRLRQSFNRPRSQTPAAAAR